MAWAGQVVRPEKIDVNITVSAGSGTAVFYCTGRIDKIAFTPPSGNPTFDYEIVDSGNYGVAGRTGLRGKVTVKVDALCIGINTFTLSNATTDGAWSVRLWIDYGA